METGGDVGATTTCLSSRALRREAVGIAHLNALRNAPVRCAIVVDMCKKPIVRSKYRRHNTE